MASNTREKIINAGLELFEKHGFASVGLDQILQQASLTKTTFYNHFDAKDDLIKAVVERRDDQFQQRFQEELRGRDLSDPKLRLLAMFDTYVEQFQQDNDVRCLMMCSVVAFPHHQDPVHQMAVQRILGRRETLERFLTEAGAPRPKEFAMRFAMIVNGAIFEWMMTANLEAFQAARRSVALLTESEMPDAVPSNGVV